MLSLLLILQLSVALETPKLCTVQTLKLPTTGLTRDNAHREMIKVFNASAMVNETRGSVPNSAKTGFLVGPIIRVEVGTMTAIGPSVQGWANVANHASVELAWRHAVNMYFLNKCAQESK